MIRTAPALAAASLASEAHWVAAASRPDCVIMTNGDGPETLREGADRRGAQPRRNRVAVG